MNEPRTRSRDVSARLASRVVALLRRPVLPGPDGPSRWILWLGALFTMGVTAAIGAPQLLGAREKARSATSDNLYVALSGEVASELEGALNGGTGTLGPVPSVAALVVPPPARLPRSATRAVVYSGEMTLVALDVRRTASRVVRITESVGGTVVAQTITGGRREPASATLSLRVPTPTFQPVTEQLAALGHVEHQTAKAVDRTDDHADLEARLVAKRALETRLLALLERAPANLADTLAVETELARVREEIETLVGRGAGLTSSVELAALEVRIDEATGEARGFRGRLAERAAAMRASLARFAEALGRVAADGFLIALPLSLAAAATLGWARRRRRSPRPARRPIAEVRR